MDNLTKNQIILHYLKEYLVLKKESTKKSSFAYNFFTSKEREDIRACLSHPDPHEITDADVIKYLIDWQENQKYLSEYPSNLYIQNILSQLGMYGHYLNSKMVVEFDDYDFSNFNRLKIKSGRAQYGYGIFMLEVYKEDIRTVDSPPLRWFPSLELAEEMKTEMTGSRDFENHELIIHQDLRAL